MAAISPRASDCPITTKPGVLKARKVDAVRPVYAHVACCVGAIHTPGCSSTNLCLWFFVFFFYFCYFFESAQIVSYASENAEMQHINLTEVKWKSC